MVKRNRLGDMLGRWWGAGIVVLALHPFHLHASQVDPSGIIPITRLFQDRDGDGIPDRSGVKVTVSGWLSADTHSYVKDRFDVFIQDDSGGVFLRGPEDLTRLGEGQRLILSGTFRQGDEFWYLDNLDLRILPRQLRLLRPVELTQYDDEEDWPVGMLVNIKGDILSVLDETDGKRVVLQYGRDVLNKVVVFWPETQRAKLDTSQFQPGDRVEVTGVLARKGPNPPFEPYFEIWPRSQEDFVRMGLPEGTLIKVGIALGLALLTGLIYMIARSFRGNQNDMVLEELQDRYQVLYESMADGVFLVDMGGKIRSANPAAEVLTGFTQEELRTKEFIHLLPNAPKSRWGEIVNATRDRNIYPCDVAVLQKPGKLITAEMKTKAVELSKKPFLMIMMQDVTAQRFADQHLEEIKEQWELTLDAVKDGVVIADKKARIVRMNSAAEKLCGVSEEDGIKKPVTEVLRLREDVKSEIVMDPVRHVLKTGQKITLPPAAVLLQSEEYPVPVSVVGMPLHDAARNVVGGLVVISNESQRVHAEGDVQKATKLESIGTLAGGIAHDFNNIMTSVIGNLSLASAFIEEDQLNEVRACVEHAQRSSQRAKSLTTQLLTFSTGGDPVKKTVDLEETLQAAIEFGLSGTSARVEKVVEKNLWPVNIDENQIIQAISNMLINASEATGGHGSIMIRARNLRVESEHRSGRVHLTPGRYVEITLADDGDGIGEEIKPKIFDPYFTTKPKNSGLGLAATHSIIQSHGGQMDVESMAGEGATFSIYLPASSGTIQKVVQPDKKLVEGSGRILIMDDEKSIRRVASFMLKKMGYEPASAACGEEALRMYTNAQEEGQPYDAVLMDLTIPGGMGGEETIAHLLKLDPNVKAIVSSGYSTDPIMSQHEKYGFVGVVAKPYTIQQLGHAIEDALCASNT